MSNIPGNSLNNNVAAAFHGRTDDVQAEFNLMSVPLTPDLLIAFCRQKLEGLDKQVTQAMIGQQARNDTSKALANLQQALNLKSSGIDDKDAAASKAAKEDVVAAYNAAIAQVGGVNTALGQKLALELEKFNKAGNGEGGEDKTGKISEKEMTSLSEGINTMQSALNRDGEMQMLELQSLVSQRQQALQLCTNLLSTMNQSAMSVVQNVGK